MQTLEPLAVASATYSASAIAHHTCLQGHPPCTTWHYRTRWYYTLADRAASLNVNPKFGPLYYQAAKGNLKTFIAAHFQKVGKCILLYKKYITQTNNGKMV